MASWASYPENPSFPFFLIQRRYEVRQEFYRAWRRNRALSVWTNHTALETVTYSTAPNFLWKYLRYQLNGHRWAPSNLSIWFHVLHIFFENILIKMNMQIFSFCWNVSETKSSEGVNFLVASEFQYILKESTGASNLNLLTQVHPQRLEYKHSNSAHCPLTLSSF